MEASATPPHPAADTQVEATAAAPSGAAGTSDSKQRGSDLAIAYPTSEQWPKLLDQFSTDAIAHKLLLAHIPYVFRDEPLKFALFRYTIAEAFHVEPTNVFIVGSAMAGRSLKGDSIEKVYVPGSDSDIDTLIVSETQFSHYVMRSLEWVRDVAASKRGEPTPKLESDVVQQIGNLAFHASKGIWRPDSLPRNAPARADFVQKFNKVALKTLGLQLSEDTVARVNGRIARSFEHAVTNLASSLYRLKKELGEEADAVDSDAGD